MKLLVGIWAVTWRILLFLVLWGVLLAPGILLLPAGSGEADRPAGPATRLLLELLGALAVLVAAWVLVRFVDRRRFTSLGFAPGGILRDLTLGLLGGSGMIALALSVSWLAGWVRTVPEEGFSGSVLGLIGAAMLLNSVTQEVLVRGYVLQTIEGRFGAPVALIASSLLFTALHAGVLAEAGALPAVNLFGAGVLLGLGYLTTRNLWLPIAWHFAWNFLLGPVLGLAVSGQALDGGWRVLELTGPPVFTGGAFGLEGGLVATFATALGIAALIAARRRLGAPGRSAGGGLGLPRARPKPVAGRSREEVA